MTFAPFVLSSIMLFITAFSVASLVFLVGLAMTSPFGLFSMGQRQEQEACKGQ